MRVLQVLAGAAQGGAETAFEDITLALHAAGIEQRVVTRGNNPDRIGRLKQAGIQVDTLPFGGLLDIYTPWAIRKIIADYHPQIVQTWMSRATQKTPASKSPKSYLKIARLGGYYSLKYFTGTDDFVAITPDIKDYLIKKGIPASRITVINNFADVEDIIRPVDRTSLNTPEEATVLLALSRYHPVKALDILIRLAAEQNDIYVWLAGEGPQEKELKKLAKDLGVENRIRFLGWRADRGALLQAADMCVFPSRYEPFGTVFVQAWAQKTPLICSKSQGPLQYVKDEVDGLMFDIDNLSQLSDAVKRLKEDKQFATQLTEAGYKRYLDEFSRDKVTESYITFYNTLLERDGLINIPEKACTAA